MKKRILLLIAIVLTLSIFIAASASLPVGTEICAEDNESSLQTPAKKILNNTPSNESNLTKRYVDDKGWVLDEVIVPGVPPEERISEPDEGRVLDEVIVPGVPPEERISEPPVLTKRYVDDEGRVLDEVIVPGVPPEERISGPPVSSSEITRADAILPNVPAFDWCYGCSATSAAMLFGYYDRTGYPNMYTGPTNGGVCPQDNSAWGYGECSLSATHQGFDGLAVKGHVDDYWSIFGSTVDPYYGHWTEHGYADCTADFMGTNQYVNWQNTDGSTRFYYYANGAPLCDYTGCEPSKRDGCHGMRLFVESRGYNMVQNCNQYIDPYVSGGFTYADFKAEIDAERPVLIHVTGHTMLGFGYNDPDTIYIHDTWGHTDHVMTWGGTYSSLDHIGVTFIQLEPEPGKDDTIVVRNGRWYVDTNHNHAADESFYYGRGTDIPLVGDVNQDGKDDTILVRDGRWYVDTDNDHAADEIFYYGRGTDIPLVGDINQDGKDDTILVRDGRWYVDTDNDHAADETFYYGRGTDIPLVGDVNQDGKDDTILVRDGRWYVDTDNDHAADETFYYGRGTDIPLVGDVNQDGKDDTILVRNGRWYVDTDNDHAADETFYYGRGTDIPLVGDIG